MPEVMWGGAGGGQRERPMKANEGKGIRWGGGGTEGACGEGFN